MLRKLRVSLGVLVISVVVPVSCSKDEAPQEPVVSSPKEPAAPPEEDPKKEELEKFEPGRVHFDYDKSDVKSDYAAVLSDLADNLKKTGRSALIEGHCDERGTVQYNLALGERRAQAVKLYLEGLGVSSSQLSIISYGEEQPLDSGHSESSWWKNRRSEFKIQ